jgi:parvulin-like peptidyl-prolyl isomerase
MFPQFEQVAFSAKPGSVSTVFETPKGFNVLKVLERKPESTQSFEDVKKDLMGEMRLVLEQDLVQAKIRELAAGARITVLDKSFARPSAPPATAAPALAAKP